MRPIDEDSATIFKHACALGCEGIVSSGSASRMPTLNQTKLGIRPSLRPTISVSDGLGEGMPWTTTQSL